VKLAVVFAMPAEFSSWRRGRAFRRARPPGQQTYEADIGGAAVRVVFTGIGARDPSRLRKALFAQPVDAVIVAGAAGGLKPPYRCGDVLVALRVKTAASERVLAADDRLVSLASRCGARIVDSFLTVDRMVVRAEDKVPLGRLADAVDMESFIVLSEAAARQVPTVAVRVITDPVGEDLPLDLGPAIRTDGTISVPRAIGAALYRPAHWPRLVHAGLSYRRALGELAAFLDRFADVLAAHAL